jgi:hypothetical protein
MQDNNNTNQYETITKYDRIYGSLHNVALHTKPTTIKVVEPVTGKTETFVIQTFRHVGADGTAGDYVFIERMDEAGVVRMVLPPKATSAVGSQKDSLTKRRRSISSKAVMKARIASGEVLGFQKKKA